MSKACLVVAIVASVAAYGPARADDCDAVLAELAATVTGLDVGERITSTGNSDTVQLKHGAADDIKLTCAPPAAHQPNQIAVVWHSAFPPPSYFDLLAAAGAIVTTNSTTTIRKGALACQKHALTADIENSEFNLASVNFSCSVTTRNGGRTAITVSSTRDDIALTQKAPPETATPELQTRKKTTTRKESGVKQSRE
ncbi:hypothetical protein [Hyphomicrobium sp.]|jgi:hypothetical protein|uniref:hypothetical protein n=1 Tax=Hyphomicrobium sp. TaxID=82 RepID=UPI003564CF3F